MKKNLLFLGCNYSQLPFLEILKNQEWNIIVADLNPDSPGKVLCDSFYNVGYDDLNNLIDIGKKEGFTQNDKVFSAAAQFAQKGAAHFAEHFNIPYVSEHSIDLCLDKAAYYDYFLQTNIPIPPTWYIRNKDELCTLILSLDQTKWYYLKSDYSKNPNYVYRFNASNINFESFFWGQDRYLREFYILQEEFSGVTLRLNLYGDRFNVIDFLSGNLTHEYHNQLKTLGIVETLLKFMTDTGLQGWLIKFDIILRDEEYVVLDVGMDPPFRMRKESKRQGIHFEKHYIDQYLYKLISYPLSLD
jgi:hypothetical protein